jgi:uncharacterized membrane protein
METVMKVGHKIARWAAVGAVVASALGGAAATQATGAPAQRAVKTAFALQSFAYGTRQKGNDQNSGRTALTVVACTSLAGLSHVNQAVGVDPPSGISAINGVRSHSWTTAHQGTVSSWASNKIHSVVLADLPAGTLKLSDIVARSHVWHDAQGYHSHGTTSLGSIKLVTAGGVVSFPVPLPGQTVMVPGVGSIKRGTPQETADGKHATASSNALVLTQQSNGSKTNMAHAFARIDANPHGGIFRGSAYSSRVTNLDGTIRSGPTTLKLMPCTGTRGQLLTISTASDFIATIGTLHGEHSSVKAVHHKNGSASGLTRNKVDKAHLVGGALVISNIRAVAHVTMTAGGKWSKSAAGTKVGKIKFNGQTLATPEPGIPLKIPGVATIFYKDVHKGKHGLVVNALKIKWLYQAAGHSTMLLGHAQLKISPK